MKYRCPYCGREIKEVAVIELTKRRVLTSVGMGIGCGLIMYPLVPGSTLVGAVGAFIVGFIIVFLMMKGKK